MSKQYYGIDKELTVPYHKGNIILQIDDAEEFRKQPLSMYIVIRGRIRINFCKPGKTIKPLQIQKDSIKTGVFDWDNPIELGEMETFGLFEGLKGP